MTFLLIVIKEYLHNSLWLLRQKSTGTYKSKTETNEELTNERRFTCPVLKSTGKHSLYKEKFGLVL